MKFNTKKSTLVDKEMSTLKFRPLLTGDVSMRLDVKFMSREQRRHLALRSSKYNSKVISA